MATIQEDQNSKEQFLNQLAKIPRYASYQDVLDDLRQRLNEDGVDILRQCSCTEKEPCWLRDRLTACNKILHTAAREITESADGGLKIAKVFTTSPADADNLPAEFTLPAEFLKDWLLSHHRCIHTINGGEDVLSGCLVPGLRTLEVSSVSGLANQSSLKHISLHSATLSEDSAKELADAVSRNKDLKTFKISRSQFTEDCSGKILAELGSSESLEAIELDYTSFGVSGAQTLAQLLRTSKSLKKLTINGGDKECVKIALEGLHDGASLEEIHLFGQEPDGSPLFMKYSEIFRNLKVVCLPCCDLDDACALELATLIETSQTLVELDVHSNLFGDRGAVAIAKALRSNKILRKLSLPQEQLTSASLVELVDALAVNTTLERLDISEVNILEEHCARLFQDPKNAGVFRRISITWKQERLKELTAILRRDDHMPNVYVDIDSGVPVADLDAFFDALLSSRTVTEVSFYPRETMFDHFVDRFAGLLRSTTTIRTVHNTMRGPDNHEETYLVTLLDALRDNKSVAEFTTMVSYLTVPMGTALGKLLEVNDTLTSLCLCEYWSVDPEVARTLANSLRHNYTLLELRIEWDAEDVDGLPEVWEALRRNKALLYSAARFVTKESEEERAAEALKKVRRSWALVEELMKQTGKREAEVRQDIADALSRVEAL